MKIEENDLLRNFNNFDLIRLLAASFVLIGHAPLILLNKPLDPDPTYILFGIGIHYIGVLMFFIISGFLVAKSWEARKNIADFLTARILRIFPAVICVVLLSVFLMGIAITTYTLPEYLSSEITAKYLQDITLYRMYYYLPGVFETNPIGSSVNGSLWTLPYEFTCYLFLIILGVLTILKKKWLSLLLLTALTFSYQLFKEKIDLIIIPVLGIDFKHFIPLFLYFLSGSVFYQFRKLISFTPAGLLLCGAAAFLIKLHYIPDLLFVFIFPYMVFFLAFSKKIKMYRIGKYGDFSYGIYLYAFPIQQLIVYFLPVEIPVWQMILLSFIFTLPMAMLSWKFIEKPALGLRYKIYSAVSKFNFR